MKQILLTTIAAVALVGCGQSQQSAPELRTKVEAMKANLLKGKWIEFGDTVRDGPETWEFHENGTVDIIDEGMKMTCKYEVTPPDTFSITVTEPFFLRRTVSVKISKSGDELTSTAGKYKKEGN